MDNIKITASFTLPGRTPIIETKEGESNKIVGYKTCTQTINMTEETYKHMLYNTCNNIGLKHWKQMSENQRIAEHLKEVQGNLGASSFEFIIYKN